MHIVHTAHGHSIRMLFDCVSFKIKFIYEDDKTTEKIAHHAQMVFDAVSMGSRAQTACSENKIKGTAEIMICKSNEIVIFRQISQIVHCCRSMNGNFVIIYPDITYYKIKSETFIWKRKFIKAQFVWLRSVQLFWGNTLQSCFTNKIIQTTATTEKKKTCIHTLHLDQ